MTRRTDRGLVLPIVLVIVVVLGIVVVAVADYASSTLRYGQTVEQSADRLAAANGALDNALEALDRSASLCALTTLANAGYEYSMLQPTATVSTINGLNPTVRCRVIGGAVTGIEEFALVLTGDAGGGTRTGALLSVAGSTTPRKVVDGPVFMARRPNVADTVSLGAPLTIQNGDLWYRRGSCPSSSVSVPLAPSGTNNLLITPAGYGIRCIVAPNWQSLFGSSRPTVPDLSALATNPAPDTTTVPGCAIFSPGRYTAQPPLGSYNYFRSGIYYFEGFELSLQNEYALFGWPGSTGPGIPGAGSDTLAENDCLAAWESDGDQSGATIYLGGSAHITLDANGALEISGRRSGDRLVGLQALESGQGGAASTVRGDSELVTVGSGSNKQVSIEGLVWAPYASFRFDNVSNDAVAALNGGAVVSEISLQAPANATNFLVTNGSTPSDRRLEFTATATSPNGATTKVRAIVMYRDGDHALESRRVMCTTPDDPDAASC